MKTTIPQLPIVDIVAKECRVPVQRLASVVPVTGSTPADFAFSILSAEEKVDLADFEVVCVCGILFKGRGKQKDECLGIVRGHSEQRSFSSIFQPIFETMESRFWLVKCLDSGLFAVRSRDAWRATERTKRENSRACDAAIILATWSSCGK